jgi:hypothetical protein
MIYLVLMPCGGRCSDIPGGGRYYHELWRCPVPGICGVFPGRHRRTPQPGIARLIGGIRIVPGSALFFGASVATITNYFMRPMQCPAKRIVDTIEYNLEQLNDLTLGEFDLLKETVATLITHWEHLKGTRHREC